jgi:hypothetical protein
LSSRLSLAAWRGVRNEDVQTGKLHAHSMVRDELLQGWAVDSLGGMRPSRGFVSYGSWAPGAGKGCRKALPDCVYVVLPACACTCTVRERERVVTSGSVCARMEPLRYLEATHF